MIPRTLLAHLARHAAAAPRNMAVAINDRQITYGEFWSSIGVAAGRLRREGVRPGDRVLIAAPRAPEFLYAYFASHLLHAVAVPFPPDTGSQKFRSIVTAVRPRVALAARPAQLDAVGCRLLSLSALGEPEVPPCAEECDGPDPDETADMLLTSGTTGAPKGVLLTHRNILAAARNINQFIGNTSTDREVVALPLSHSFGLGRVRCQVLAGGALILAAGFVFLKQMFETIRSWEATGLAFVPAAWTMLSRLTGERLGGFSHQLRYIEIGSAPMPLAEKERLRRLFPATRLCMHYGLTEASRSTFIEFHESGDRLDSVGRPAPNVEIRILDEDGHELPPRQTGRIMIRGDHVMAGYWNAATEERLADGWLRSGDLGYRDEEGYLYLCGREDDVINVGGRKVYPAEVEQALLGHECIEDAVCIGTRDPEEVTGERVRAFLVARRGRGAQPSPSELADFLAGRLEEHQIPIGFDWVDSIPRNDAGKIERKTLADLAAGSSVKAEA